MVRSQTRKLNRFSLLNFRLLRVAKGGDNFEDMEAAEISGAVWFAGVGIYAYGKNQNVQKVVHRSCTQVLYALKFQHKCDHKKFANV